MANNRFRLDAVKEIAALRGLGYSEARKAAPHLTEFFAAPAADFEPIRKLPQAPTAHVEEAG